VSEIILLHSVAFYVVRSVHKFDFRLIINEKKLRHTVTETHVFDRICMFSPGGCHECLGALLMLYKSAAVS
jgi:hypothetical protein